MTELTIALKTIFDWLKENYPRLEESFEPALDFEQLKVYDDRLNDIHFTSEFYELYQWSNGTLTYPAGEIINIDGKFGVLDDGGYLSNLEESHNNIFDTIDCIEPFSAIFFCPMESIDFVSCRKEGDNRNIVYLQPFLFGTNGGSELIFSNEKKYTSTLLSSVPDIENCFEPVYASLTDKFVDLAKSIKAEAYFTEDTKYGKALFVDQSKICRKHRIYSNDEDWLFLE